MLLRTQQNAPVGVVVFFPLLTVTEDGGGGRSLAIAANNHASPIVQPCSPWLRSVLAKPGHQGAYLMSASFGPLSSVRLCWQLVESERSVRSEGEAAGGGRRDKES